MPGYIVESHVSRPFTLGSQAVRELIFSVLGTDDELEVQEIVRLAIPPVYGGLAFDSVQAEPEWTSYGDGLWKVHVRYVGSGDQSEYTFDTSGGTQKILQAPVVSSYAAGVLPPPDFEGAIGVSEDRVEGADITIPQFVFSETHLMDATLVDSIYKKVLFRLTGKVNQFAFKGFDPGECLFLGASGTKRGNEKWSITYRFAGSANAIDLVVGPMTGIVKDGWDYLWARYADVVDSSAYLLVKRPIAAYVHRVYVRDDFGDLLIGVT